MNAAAAILTTAAALVSGDRNVSHGPLPTNMGNFAGLVSAYLTAKLQTPVALDGADAAAIMVLSKLARTITGTHNPDDFVDGAGYFAGMGACRDVAASA